MRGNEFSGVCFLVYLVVLGRKQDSGTSFPHSSFNYMTKCTTTQGLVLPARSEQFALFLTPIRWTIVDADFSTTPDIVWIMDNCCTEYF